MRQVCWFIKCFHFPCTPNHQFQSAFSIFIIRFVAFFRHNSLESFVLIFFTCVPLSREDKKIGGKFKSNTFKHIYFAFFRFLFSPTIHFTQSPRSNVLYYNCMNSLLRYILFIYISLVEISNPKGPNFLCVCVCFFFCIANEKIH